MKQSDDVVTSELCKLRGNAHSRIIAIFADRFSGENGKIKPLSISDLCPSGDIFKEVKKYCLEVSPLLEKDTSGLMDLRIKRVIERVFNMALRRYISFRHTCANDVIIRPVEGKVWELFSDRAVGNKSVTLRMLLPGGEIYGKIKRYIRDESVQDTIDVENADELVEFVIKSVYNVTLASYFHSSC